MKPRGGASAALTEQTPTSAASSPADCSTGAITSCDPSHIALPATVGALLLHPRTTTRLTTSRDAAELRETCAIRLSPTLALGLDTSRAAPLSARATCPKCGEISWILTDLRPGTARARRLATRRNSSAGSSPTSAWYQTYPALMAADILAYDSDFVPWRRPAQHGGDPPGLAASSPRLRRRVQATRGVDLAQPPRQGAGADGQKMRQELRLHGVDLRDRKSAAKPSAHRHRFRAAGEPNDPDALLLVRVLAPVPRAGEHEEWGAPLKERRAPARRTPPQAAPDPGRQDTFGRLRARRAELLRDPRRIDALPRAGAEIARAPRATRDRALRAASA
jgi:tryptophanyl-tRNA synthetase